MKTSLEEFQSYYQSLSDEALRELDRNDLVEAARACYDQELAGRGLTAANAPNDLSAAPADGREHREIAASFFSVQEAGLALALLQSAGIPSSLEDENTDLRSGSMWSSQGNGLRLTVPAEFLEEARAILESDVSEADLIAQAEVAEEIPETSELDD